MSGHLGQNVAGSVDQTSLAQGAVEDDLRRADEALPAVADDEQRVTQAPGLEAPGKNPTHASWDSDEPGSRPKNMGFPAAVMPRRRAPAPPAHPGAS